MTYKKSPAASNDSPAPLVDCAYDGCCRGATIKLQTKTGWAKRLRLS
jgi:hypothetical protein